VISYKFFDHSYNLTLFNYQKIMPIQKTDKELCFDSLDYHKTLQGDYKILEQALQLVDSVVYDDNCNYEKHPAVLTLCNWWNGNAPKNMRYAAWFVVHIYDAKNNWFESNIEVPICGIGDYFASYALFKAKDKPIILIEFLRGKEFNTFGDKGTTIYDASGEPYIDIGAPLVEVDEAFDAIKSLSAVDLSKKVVDYELLQPQTSYERILAFAKEEGCELNLNHNNINAIIKWVIHKYG
jgi:hypothetical protein